MLSDVYNTGNTNVSSFFLENVYDFKLLSMTATFITSVTQHMRIDSTTWLLVAVAGAHVDMRSMVETFLSCKSWGKRLEHVPLYNKGIALQTTRKIGTQLKPCSVEPVCGTSKGHGGEVLM